MKTAVHFGAGNIGRGFITPILQENEYEVTFIDINSELIKQINSLNKYKITSLGLETNTDKYIENINGIDLNDNSKVTEKIAEADLITTSVGPKFVNEIFKIISKITTSKQQSFIAFENMYRASTSNLKTPLYSWFTKTLLFHKTRCLLEFSKPRILFLSSQV